MESICSPFARGVERAKEGNLVHGMKKGAMFAHR